MKGKWKEDICFLSLKLIMVFLVLAVMLLWVFGLARCADNAMDPSCKDGDIVLFDRMAKDYEARELIVLSVDNETQVRRIVAVPGDTVEITEEGLFLNGYRQQEAESTTMTQPYAEGIRYPVTLKTDEYFVLADRRANARDSRLYGVVREDEVKGTVVALFRHRGF